MSVPPPERPRAVIFDLGNTLALPNWPRITAVAGRVARLGVSEGELRRRMCEVVAEADRSEDFLRALAERRLPTGWEHRELFRPIVGDEALLEQMVSALNDEHRKRHLWDALNPEAVPALQGLRREGVRLAVVSNSADGRACELVGQLGVGGYLEFCLDSHHLGFAKPDPRIFSLAVSRLGVPPGEAVYVGDSYAQDVAGAERAGLKGVLYDPLNLQPRPGVRRVRSLDELIA